MTSPGASESGYTGRDVLALAWPALLTLIVEPLFLLADTAIVGRLGAAPLAGLGAASSLLLTTVGLFVFLAYGTTAAVARLLGAGDRRRALTTGAQGIWLSALLGVAAAVALWAGAPALTEAFGLSPAATADALSYTRISSASVPAMLVVFAATGVLRGIRDMRTPLLVAAAGFTWNIALNIWLVFGRGWGIAGSAWGTVIAQNAMAVTLVVVVVRHLRRSGATAKPRVAGLVMAARGSFPLFIRTVALRLTLLITTWVAAGLGDVVLAGYQVSATLWSFLVFALDALAIAAQTLIGHALGAGDPAAVRSLTRLLVRWGIRAGVVLGLAVLALAPVLPALFTSDPAVQGAVRSALWVIAALQPVSGWAFILDGVLIGAGDGRWLAFAQLLLLMAYLPLILGVHLATETLLGAGIPAATTALWVAFGGFMVMRAALLHARTRSADWTVLS